MLIRDLEYKSGLDRATIRYYEKEGLIEPERHENGYRNYSEEQLSQLLKIKLLRQLGLSLESIKELQKGTGNLDTVLRKQILILESQIDRSQYAKKVCVQLCDDGARYETLNAEYYLQLFLQKEETDVTQAFSENIQQPFHPWRRFWARIVDYAWIDLVLSIFFSVILRIRPFANCWISVLLSFVALVIAIPVLAAMIHLWGTTPGKWLFGLSVVSENGNKLDFSAAKGREVDVFVRGYGLGLPVFCFIRLIMSYNFYRNNVPDLDDTVEHRYSDFKKSKVLLAFLIVIALNISNCLIAADAYQPRYQGDLSIKEFSKNYNFYAKILDENSARMEPDGTFEGMCGVITHMEGEPGNANLDFKYDTENGHIQSISYCNSWTSCAAITPVGSTCETAIVAAVMSQKGTNIIDLFRIIKVLRESDKCSSEQIHYKNVSVSWSIDANNFTASDGQYLIANKDTDSSGDETIVSINFSIVIDHVPE